jgi:cell division septation protein DedD
MNELPVGPRTQRRLERRQMVVMLILVMAVTVASFFLGVMVGERGNFPGFSPRVEPPRLPMAQIAPPPLPSSVVPAGPQKLTFYDDLPKGNAAPLGSGINLPKGGYASPPPPVPVAAAAPAPAAPASATPAVATPAAAPTPVPAAAVPKASAGGNFVVQVAATKDQAEAKRMVDKLAGKGVAASTERADLGAKGIWYRVVAGPYGDQAVAEKVAEQLKKQKFSAMVRKY